MQPRKILLADANADCRDLLRLYLDFLRYPAPIVAQDGSDALTKALCEEPDLIIMEVFLPKMSGFDVVAQLRSSPRTSDAWILAATAMAMPGDRERCLAGGFDAYLAKPFTFNELRLLLPGNSPKSDSSGREFSGRGR